MYAYDKGYKYSIGNTVQSGKGSEYDDILPMGNERTRSAAGKSGF